MRKSIFALMILFSCYLFVGCGKDDKIDLTEYIQITYTGLNGQATAECQMDYPGLEVVLLDGKTDDLDLVAKVAAVETSIDVNLDKKENLTNGDKVTVSLTWDSNLEEKSGYKFKGKEKEIVVEGLKEGTVIDVFKDITLEYKGVAPEAELIICNAADDAFLKTVNYTADNKKNLSNGNKIIVTADYDEEKAVQYGYIVNEISKEYIATGIDAYLNEYSQIDDETLSKLKEQANDLIESKLADRYDYSTLMYPNEFKLGMDTSKVKIKSIKLINSYFFSLKKGMEKGWSDVNNSLFTVYEVKAVDEDSPKGVTALIAVYFSDFIMRESGAVDIVVTDARITDSYGNYDDMYRNIVTANKAKYKYEEITY